MAVDRNARMAHRQVLESLSGLLPALFVAMISSTVVSTALPPIIGSLNGTQTRCTWVVTATLLTATATTSVWNRSRGAGHRRRRAPGTGAVVIASIIPPRERGRHNGYLGGDGRRHGRRAAARRADRRRAVAGLAVVLQRTLRLEPTRRDDVRVDYLGACLITAG
jgi:hypothetical protein